MEVILILTIKLKNLEKQIILNKIIMPLRYIYNADKHIFEEENPTCFKKNTINNTDNIFKKTPKKTFVDRLTNLFVHCK